MSLEKVACRKRFSKNLLLGKMVLENFSLEKFVVRENALEEFVVRENVLEKVSCSYFKQLACSVSDLPLLKIFLCFDPFGIELMVEGIPYIENF